MKFLSRYNTGRSGNRIAGTALSYFVAAIIVGLCLPVDTPAMAQANIINLLQQKAKNKNANPLPKRSAVPNVVQKNVQKNIQKNAIQKNLIQKKGPLAGKQPLQPKTKAADFAPKGKGLQPKGLQPKTAQDGKLNALKGKDGKLNPQTGKGLDGKSKLGKGLDTKGKPQIGKGPDGKIKSQVGKGPDSKIKSQTGKGPDGKSKLGLSKDGKSQLGKSQLGKSAVGKPKETIRYVAKKAPAERRVFEVKHRSQLAVVRARLPRRPLPGDPGFTGVPPPSEKRYIARNMVFQVGPNVSPQAVQALAQRRGLTVVSSQPMGLTGGTLYQFRIADNRSVPDVVRTLEADRLGVAQPEYVFRTQQEPQAPSSPGDAAQRPGDPAQYVLDKLRLGEVHQRTRGANVLIAVIDSEIDRTHPDLVDAIAEEFDAVGGVRAPHPHGTGMVGAIAAHRKLMGIAPAARILAIRAFSPNVRQSPQATTRHIISGIQWAVDKGARVINMSFAGPHDPMLALAMKRAHEKGVVLVAASGNAGPKSPPLFPAADPHVIAVTATDESDELMPQAVRGPHVAVSAPGVDIMVPAPSEAYQLTTGTSVAAAHVSGVAALLIERFPNASASLILEVLTATARKLNPQGRDDQFGWGLVDPGAALEELEERMGTGRPDQPPATASVAQPVPMPAAAVQGPAPAALQPTTPPAVWPAVQPASHPATRPDPSPMVPASSQPIEGPVPLPPPRPPVRKQASPQKAAPKAGAPMQLAPSPAAAR